MTAVVAVRVELSGIHRAVSTAASARMVAASHVSGIQRWLTVGMCGGFSGRESNEQLVSETLHIAHTASLERKESDRNTTTRLLR
jgi:hypothetical protein